MTNIELEVAHSTIRKNKAVASKLENIDWEQRRYEIAKTMMPQVFHELTAILNAGGRVEGAYGKTPQELTAERTVWYADALIAELKKEEQDGTETNQDPAPATEG